MKTNCKKLIALIAGVIFFSCSSSMAQDWSKMDAKAVKKLADTTLIRAYEVTIMPKEKGQVHTHPAHFFYALTDCNLVVHYADGKDEKFDIPSGSSGYSNGEGPHWTENKGDKAAKFLVVELKEHPYKEPRKK